MDEQPSGRRWKPSLWLGVALVRALRNSGQEAVYPGLLDGLAQHEGIGFVLVHSEAHGPVVIGARGQTHLAENRVGGENPLADGIARGIGWLADTAFPDVPQHAARAGRGSRRRGYPARHP